MTDETTQENIITIRSIAGREIWTGVAGSMREAVQGADLSGADLSRADLSGADLDPIRADIRAVLDAAPNEVTGLLAKLRAGQIDGSVYEGECACLVGTIGNVRGCYFTAIEGLAPNASRPAERFFLAIQPGFTPENHPVAKIVEGWILEWMKEKGIVDTAKILVWSIRVGEHCMTLEEAKSIRRQLAKQVGRGKLSIVRVTRKAKAAP